MNERFLVISPCLNFLQTKLLLHEEDIPLLIKRIVENDSVLKNVFQTRNNGINVVYAAFIKSNANNASKCYDYIMELGRFVVHCTNEKCCINIT